MAKRLYVGNISFKATEEELRDFFSAVGAVESVRMILVPQTGQPKGFAFVEMANDDDAKKSIASLNGKPFMGRELRVSEARPSRPLEQRAGYGGIGAFDRSKKNPGQVLNRISPGLSIGNHGSSPKGTGERRHALLRKRKKTALLSRT